MDNIPTLPDRDVLTLAVSGDKDAVKELMQRQRKGRALRLYLRPRADGDDEGLIPFMLEVEPFNVSISIGRSVRCLMDRTFSMQVIRAVAKGFEGLITICAEYGYSQDEITQAIADGATPDLAFLITPIIEHDLIGVVFEPKELLTWRLGIEDAQAFIHGMVDAMHQMDWIVPSDVLEDVRRFL